MFNVEQVAHRRFNVLTGQWLLCSPKRTKRPWQGATSTTGSAAASSSSAVAMQHDDSCYLCPRNKRASGAQNDDYKSTFIFDNDFAALRVDDETDNEQKDKTIDNDNDETDNEQKDKTIDDALFRVARARGICRVICYSPDHCKAMSELAVEQVAHVVDAWCEQSRVLFDSAAMRVVQIFENRGDLMGCSNPHPHGQVWACAHVPDKVQRRVDAFKAFDREHGCCSLCAYVERELRNGNDDGGGGGGVANRNRVVLENEHWVVLVPYWAYWPFETLVTSKRHMARIDATSDAERVALASVLSSLTKLYDRAFNVSFPYSMGIIQQPQPIESLSSPFHVHIEFYPPLLRSKSVKKYRVGYELFADECRDITAESVAERLRQLLAE
jgi:UDPglucose--hexose-1-phosphate uridylyltransferase